MARMKRPAIKLVFTAEAENVEYTEGLNEAFAAPIDIRSLMLDFGVELGADQNQIR
jgi:hypothetical protein